MSLRVFLHVVDGVTIDLSSLSTTANGQRCLRGNGEKAAREPH